MAITQIIHVMHNGCREKMYDSGEDTVQSKAIMFCPDTKMIRFTRFCGGGTVVFVMILLAAYLYQ